jgi:predicted TIM-barrel fold metal-dependent hydrolase
VRGAYDPSLPKLADLLKQGNVWVMMSNGHRVSTWPGCEEAIPVGKALIKANPDRLIWGTDWPHPLHDKFMPNDADLLDLILDWAPEGAARRRIMIDNPAELFGFD